jgi:hypothetical protein
LNEKIHFSPDSFINSCVHGGLSASVCSEPDQVGESDCRTKSGGCWTANTPNRRGASEFSGHTAKLSVDGKEVSSKEMTVNGDTHTTETLKLDTPGTHKIEFCGVTKTIRVIPMPGLQNILSEQQLLEDINKLEQDQLITRSVLNMISKVNSTIYYKLTGNTWENAKIATHFLNHNKYLHDTHTKLAGYSSPGKIWVDTGDAGKKIYPMGILLTLFHETGHVEAFRLTARIKIMLIF